MDHNVDGLDDNVTQPDLYVEDAKSHVVHLFANFAWSMSV
jgi:hypothetical protein